MRGPITILLVAAFLTGGCGPREEAPDAPPEETTLGADSAREAEAGPEPSEPGTLTLKDIPFEPSGTFPHGEHRGIRCATCHDAVPGHSSHTSVSCTDCHGVPRDYAVLPVLSEAQCMSCHHDPKRPESCDRCHSSLPEDDLLTLAAVRMSVWDEERSRSFSFDHSRHDGVECRTCHQEAPNNAVIRRCGSCHEDHHRPKASCGLCHQPEEGEHHDPSVHLGCAGTGCHRDPAVEALPATRPFCLVCHSAQVQHEAGKACTGCHSLGGFEAPEAESSEGGGWTPP